MKEQMDALGKEVIEINTANGWNVTRPTDWENTYKIPAVLALIHSEVSEALEAFRKNDRLNFDEEIADIVIRCLDLAYGLETNLPENIASKLIKNRARGERHGGKKL